VVEVGPADALAVSATQPPYRTPSGCGTVGSGVMSVARMDAEIAARKAVDQAALDAMDPPVAPAAAEGYGQGGGGGGGGGGAPGSSMVAAQQRRPDGRAQPYDMRALQVTAGSGQVSSSCAPPLSSWAAIKTALISWAHGMRTAPFEQSTWTNNDAWVCILIIFLMFVGFVVILAVAGVAMNEKRIANQNRRALPSLGGVSSGGGRWRV
jgi:hypothetical protein